jgi:hypothetical protein
MAAIDLDRKTIRVSVPGDLYVRAAAVAGRTGHNISSLTRYALTRLVEEEEKKA